MNDPTLADVLMQREHLSRQQRIRLVHKATQRRRSRPSSGSVVAGIHDGVAAVTKARSNTPARATTTRHGTMHGRRRKPKDHSEHVTVEAVRKARQGHARAVSSRDGITRGQIHHERRPDKRESDALRTEKKEREDAAELHYLRATLRKVWRALKSVTEIALLQKVKAERHYQYCVMHRIWINLLHNVVCSRAHKTEQVQRLVISLKKREAWKRWKHHHQGLVSASNMVRRERTTSLVSQHFSTWIEAWTIQARRSAVVEHVATRRGQRARKSRFFHAWKYASDTSKQRTLLAEERFQMWQRVEHWLTPADSL